MSEIVTVGVPRFFEESTMYDTKYKRTMKWNPVTGDFVRDGANRIQECSGEEGFMIWCLKTAMTERHACLAYPNEIGTELEKATKDNEAEIVESQVERTITDAIQVNPRTEYIGDFNFTWNGDDMHCTFNVKGMEWDKTFQISI